MVGEEHGSWQESEWEQFCQHAFVPNSVKGLGDAERQCFWAIFKCGRRGVRDDSRITHGTKLSKVAMAVAQQLFALDKRAQLVGKHSSEH